MAKFREFLEKTQYLMNIHYLSYSPTKRRQKSINIKVDHLNRKTDGFVHIVLTYLIQDRFKFLPVTIRFLEQLKIILSLCGLVIHFIACCVQEPNATTT